MQLELIVEDALELELSISPTIYIHASNVGPQGPAGEGSRLWNIKNYDPLIPIDKDNYHYIRLDANIHSGNVQMPTNPENGENYTIYYLGGPNDINIVFTPKSIIGHGFNVLPIPGNSQSLWTFTIFYDEILDLWMIYYSSNN